MYRVNKILYGGYLNQLYKGCLIIHKSVRASSFENTSFHMKDDNGYFWLKYNDFLEFIQNNEVEGVCIDDDCIRIVENNDLTDKMNDCIQFLGAFLDDPRYLDGYTTYYNISPKVFKDCHIVTGSSSLVTCPIWYLLKALDDKKESHIIKEDEYIAVADDCIYLRNGLYFTYRIKDKEKLMKYLAKYSLFSM